MSELLVEVQNTAEKALAAFQDRAEGKLDFSEASLEIVEEMLAEAAEFRDDLPEAQIDSLVQMFGCYILEVGRRRFGGEYLWHDQQQEPVLVVGEPLTHIAIATWGKVRGRIAGDEANNIPFFFSGFANDAAEATPGKRVLYV